MAQFSKIELTRLGKNIILAGQNKQQVVFTKVELGDGLLSIGQSVDVLTGLVHSVTSMPLQNFVDNGDGTARLRFVLDNNNLEKGFFNREIGVFAKVGDGIEQLYAYTNAGNLADYIPSKESPISSKIINLHIVVGNAANLTIVAENSAYVTKLDMDEHKDKKELDHPNGSVTTPKIKDEAVTGEKIAQGAIEKKHLKNGIIGSSDVGAYSKKETDDLIKSHRTAAELDHLEKSVKRKHLADNVYTLPAPEATNATRFVGGDHKVRDVTPGSIGAYSKNETNDLLAQKAPLASPALTGTPTVPTAGKGTNNGQIASTAFVAQAIAALVNSAPGALDTLQELAAALGNDANFATTVTNALAGKVSKSGDTMIANLNFSGANIGIQGTHGYMQFGGNDKGDAIESNGANVNIASWWGLGFYDLCGKRYTGTMDLRSGNWRTVGAIRADQGFIGNLAGTSSNADKLGGQSLQWILDQIGAAKTGVVASNLAENGWVKFANGLIVQWGIAKNGSGTQRVSFPISFGSKVFHINFSSTILSNDAVTNSAIQNYSLTGAELYANTSPAGYVLWFAIGI